MRTAPDSYEPQFYLWHEAGPTLRATFSSESDAEVWQRGNAGMRAADAFYITNTNGDRVTFKRNRYGHAHALLTAANTPKGG